MLLINGLCMCGLMGMLGTVSIEKESKAAYENYSQNIESSDIVHAAEDDMMVDNFEPNDNYFSATLLSNQKKDDYDFYAYLESKLDTNAEDVDCDYYYFTLLVDANVSIDIKTNSSYSYDFALINYIYNNTSESISRSENILFYNDSTDKQKKFCSDLTAGTYFVYLKGQQPYDSGEVVNYSLSVSYNEELCDEFHSFKSMQESNNYGALWISDLLPANFLPDLTLSNDILYYQYNKQGVHLPEYSIDELALKANGAPIHIASYYIWNPIVKNTMYKLYSHLSDIFADYNNEKQAKIDKYEIVYDTISNGIKFTSYVAGKIFDSTLIKVCVKVFDIISEKTLNYIFNAITPKYTKNDVSYAYYLGYYTGIFESYKNDYGLDEYKMTINDDHKVVSIPLFVSINETSALIPRDSKKYLSFIDTATVILNNRNCLMESNNILCFSTGLEVNENFENTYQPKGKIYTLEKNLSYKGKDDMSIFKFHNHSFKYEQLNIDHHIAKCVCGYKIYEKHNVIDDKCTKCNAGYSAWHNYNHKYEWHSLTDHYAYCKCGQKTLQPHIVSSGNSKYKTCLLCGGSASMGFIGEFSYINGLYFINIVPLLKPDDIRLKEGGVV